VGYEEVPGLNQIKHSKKVSSVKEAIFAFKYLIVSEEK
jgi:hypothetical protein